MITLAELQEGVLAAQSPNIAKARQEFIDQITADLKILPYLADTALNHATLLRFTRLNGVPRGAHDLIIAAHARETGRIVVSLDNKGRFGDLPGVQVRTKSELDSSSSCQ